MDNHDNLAPADTALIADEESRYDQCADRIRQALRAKTAELSDDEMRARALTAELVAEKNDEEKQFLQSDEKVAHGLAHLRYAQAGALSELSRQPYFARVIYKEKNRPVEFRLGVAAYPEERIVDWRKAPLSRLYYDYEEGDCYDDEIAGVERRGEILLKRAYRARPDGLTGIETRSASFAKSGGAWHRFGKLSRALFSIKDKEKIREVMTSQTPIAIEQLAREDAYLSQILALITPEQFKLISAETARPMIIRGSAGTGKTTVALHRLAWLLFSGNAPAKAENCLVIMPNRTLVEYVKNVLPSLGAGPVAVTTYDDWARDIIATSLPQESPKNRVSRKDVAPLLEQVMASTGAYSARRFPARPDHLVIDEAQDFSSGELATMIASLADPCQITLAGDPGQRIHGDGKDTWEDLLRASGLDSAHAVTLSVAFRSTWQIYEIAEFTRDPGLHDDDLKMQARFGPDPLLTVCHNEADAIAMTKAWVEDVVNLDQRVTGAVICRHHADAARLYRVLKDAGLHAVRLGDREHFEFTPGITITDAVRVKGLEFQCVLVFNADAKNYSADNPLERNLLYVAISRALYRLDFIVCGETTPLLPEFIQTRDLTALAEENANEETRLADMLDEWRKNDATHGLEATDDDTATGQTIGKSDGEDLDEESSRDMLDELESGDVPVDSPSDDDDDNIDKLNEFDPDEEKD